MAIASIHDAVESVIEDITPDVRSGVLFRLAPYNGRLEDMPLGRGVDGTRRFHVLVGPLANVGGATGSQWNGDGFLYLGEPLLVRVRYAQPLNDGGYRKLLQLTASDQNRIIQQLSRVNGTAWGSGRPDTIEPTGGVSIEPVTGENANAPVDIWIFNIAFRIMHPVGNN